MKKLLILVLASQFCCDAKGQVLHKVYPNATDPNINLFTTSYNYCYTPALAKNKLLIFLPGAGAQPSGSQKWMSTAQEQGFHVIGLYYPNITIGSEYDTISGGQWINQYAYEIMFGEDRSPAANIDYANCIENRIIKCLQWLQLNYPTEGWWHYLNGDSLIYSKCIFSGHSYGGNFAACIGKFKQVARVICVSSPRIVPETDWGTFQTPLNRYFFFWHNLDKASLGVDQYTILQQMGIIKLVVITEQTDSSLWGHILKTIYACAPAKAHKIVISDSTTPIISGVPYYKPVWIYLMTQ